MLIPTVTVLLRLDFGTVNGPAETALLIVSDRPANSSKRSAASSPRRTGVGGQSHQQQVLLGSMQPTHTAGGNAPSGRWRCRSAHGPQRMPIDHPRGPGPPRR